MRRLDDADSLESAVRQAVGAASMCWESVDQAGVFQDGRANEVATELVDGIREGRWPDDDRDRARPGVIDRNVPEHVGIDDDPEFFHGLTMWGSEWSAQVRDGHIVLAFSSGDDQAPYAEHEVDVDEARRLRDLLNVATARGYL